MKHVSTTVIPGDNNMTIQMVFKPISSRPSSEELLNIVTATARHIREVMVARKITEVRVSLAFDGKVR